MINTLSILLISYINVSNMNNMIYIIGYKNYLLLIYELTSSYSFKWEIIEINKIVLEVNHSIKWEDIIDYSMYIGN